MSLENDVDRFVRPFEDEFDKRVGWQFEIGKLLLSQMFTLNWAALIAVPTVVAAVRDKTEIISIAAGPMIAFAAALILAMACGLFAYRGLHHATRESDENANAAVVRVLKRNVGIHPADNPNEPQFAGSDVRALDHRGFGKRSLLRSEVTALLSLVLFIVGVGLFAFNLSK